MNFKVSIEILANLAAMEKSLRKSEKIAAAVISLEKLSWCASIERKHECNC